MSEIEVNENKANVYVQVLLMLLILLTGNYNFFNIVTIFLCLPLVDDDWLLGWSSSRAAHTGTVSCHFLLAIIFSCNVCAWTVFVRC